MMSYGYYQGGYNTGAMPDMLSQYRQMQAPPSMSLPQMPQPQPQQPSNGMIWVQGEAGAKSYLVAPGNTVVLWDSEDPVIYIKSAEPSGMPTMRVLEYTERTATARRQNDGVTAAVTIDMFNDLKGKYEALAAKLGEVLREKGAENNG